MKTDNTAQRNPSDEKEFTIEEIQKRRETEKRLKEIDKIRNSPLKSSDKSFGLLFE